MTNYLKQAARLKGHKNIKGRKEMENPEEQLNSLTQIMTRLSSQKRSFSSKASSCTLLNISFLQSVEIWASNLSSFFSNQFFFIWYLTLLYSQCFQSKMWWPQWQLNWGSGNKGVVGKILLVFLGKMFNCFMDKFCDILLGQSSVTFLGHLFQYFLDKY